MPIREARFSDHAALAALCSAAFFEEDLFGRVMHPHRHEYPDDVPMFWHQFIRDHWADWQNKLIVALRPDVENPNVEAIAGLAVWQRQGEGGKKMVPSSLDPRNLLHPCVKISNRISSLLYVNRALDPTKLNVLEDSMPYCEHHWHGDRAENWYLSLCAVHPDYQGKGVGREIVKWGLDEAEKENIHASVMSSKGNEDFYLRCGFDEIVGNGTEGEGNPLAGVPGGAILFKYPRKD